MNDLQVKFIIYQIMRGLKYIHSAGIIHRWTLFVNCHRHNDNIMITET